MPGKALTASSTSAAQQLLLLWKCPEMGPRPDALAQARDYFQVKFYPVDRKCVHSFAKPVSL